MIFRHLRNIHGFFSDYYLGSVFGRGQGRGRRTTVSERETDLVYHRFRRIRERAEGRAVDAYACRERFLRPLLRDVLGFHLGMGEERIHPLYRSAEAEQAEERPLLLAYCGVWDEDLDAGRGNQNPMRRLEQALAQAELPYGLLLTGERARLVRAPGEGPRGAYLEADLAGLADEEDPESFAAFLRLFSAANFVPDGDGKLPIEEIERASREHAERVSDDLKQAVFTAAESLVSGLIADAVARGDLSSPLDLDDKRLCEFRDAALLGLYRILFILYAEARDPRLIKHTLYWKNYSAQGLVDEILGDPGRTWPENRCFFWERLRALFCIYDEGLPPITSYEHIPPRGSDFFSRRTPEGKILDAARLSDRQVAQLLLDLATTTPRRGVGRERISFRELDIEQLGAVYEGLLEYEPWIVRELSLALRVQGRALVLTPAEVVRLCQQNNLTLHGDLAIVQGTEAERLHPAALDEEEEDIAEETEPAEAEADAEEVETNEAEEEGVSRGATARLVRRLEPGTFHFVPGPGRKGSGSFYTPRALVQDLVRHALGPLVEGKTAAEIERLRVLDPACGSAHFLVEAMRFLGQALHRAYVEEYGGKAPPEFRSTTGQGWDTDWQASDEGARAANSEARAWCKRRIAERCLYGVDLNPTAVQLARVALWIESVAGDRPLTYFEHHIRPGNSLLGTWMERLEEPPLPEKGVARKIRGERQPGLFQNIVREAIRKAAELRRIIDEVRPEDLRREGVEPESVDEQAYKALLLEQVEQTLAAARLLFDLRSVSAFVPEIWREWDTLTSFISDPARLHTYAKNRPWWRAFREVKERERFFHWELEFPEVFLDPEHPGFDAVLGNPPWDKIKPDRREFYARYDILIRAFVGGELDRRIEELERAIPTLPEEFRDYENRLKTLTAYLKKGGDYRYQDWKVDGKSTGGDPDAFKFFVERAWQLVREGGRVGFVVPSAIYNNEGCTGLRYLLLHEAQVERFYAFENRKKIFPIDSRYKFVSLVFRKGRPEGDGFEAAFMRHDLAELEATARYRGPGQDKVKPFAAPWIVSMRRQELERLSPGTLAFLEYRTPRDREILLKMYGYDAQGNPVNPRPLLGDQGPDTWNARFYREFDMTNDRDLWTDPKSGKLYNPRQILGPVPGTKTEPPYYDPAAWPEIRARMAEKGFWPLYEGKHIEQFLVDIKPIERWVSLEACERKYGKLPEAGPKLVFRAIARNTDERTCIAAVLPERSCFGNSCWGCVLEQEAAETLCTVLNSFPADFAVRFRVSSNMNFTHAGKMAVLHPDTATRLPRLASQSAVYFGVENMFDYKQSWSALWSLNRAVAEAYGLGPDDFEYMLTTFPVFARKRPGFYAYLKERLAEWREEVETGSPTTARKMYPVPTRAGIAQAAECRMPYLASDQPDGRRHTGYDRYNQAAVLAFIVHTLGRSDLGRVGHDKMVYFVQEHLGVDLGLKFQRKAAGPWDPDLKHKVEPLAVKLGWLRVSKPGRIDIPLYLVPGPNISDALAQAAKKLGGVLGQVTGLCKFFNALNFGAAGLERWATIHKCWKDLQAQGSPVSEDRLVQEVLAWKGDREEYAEESIRKAIRGMTAEGIIVVDG